MAERARFQNFAKLKDTEIEFNDITVLAGKLSTGKSYVMKYFYAINEMFYQKQHNKLITFDIEDESISSGLQYYSMLGYSSEIAPLAENINSMLMTSLKKVSNTADILVKQFDVNKTANMPIFYLYCKSGKSIDRVMSNYLSRHRKNIFIDCDKLKEKLEQECL